MSTYSWSYKNASHRQIPAKKTTSEENINEAAINTGGATTTATSTSTSSCLPTQNTINSKLKQEQITTRPKRLNWKAKLYVGNLNKKTTEASLAYYFRVFGDLDDVKLIRDHDTGESRGFAFITFEKLESAEKAKKWCSFNYPTIDDNSITVASAERKVPKIKPVNSNEYTERLAPFQTLFWEYKWSNEQNAQVYGPYETSLMLSWKNQGYFDSGCWVRQVHRDSRIVNHHREENVVETSSIKESDERPSKKFKLVVDYSDSDDEEQMNDGKNKVLGTEQETGEEGEKRTEKREEEYVKYGEIFGGKGQGQKQEMNKMDEKRGINQKVKGTVETEEKGEKECENGEVNKRVRKKDLEREVKKQEMDGVEGKESREIIQEVKEIVENIVEMIVENEHLLTKYIEHDIRTMFEDEEKVVERKRCSSSDEEDMMETIDELSTEFVDISEIDFSFFP